MVGNGAPLHRVGLERIVRTHDLGALGEADADQTSEESQDAQRRLGHWAVAEQPEDGDASNKSDEYGGRPGGAEIYCNVFHELKVHRVFSYEF